jgi:putative membrane protein
MWEQQAASWQAWKPFLKRWAITTLAVLIAANVVSGIEYRSWSSLLAASLLLGLLNAFLRPALLLLSLPLLIYSLGLFVLVINAVLLALVGTLVPGFHVAGFWPAFWGALLISLVSLVTKVLTWRGVRFTVEDHRDSHDRRPPPPRPPPPGDGPVIDV